MPRPIVAIRNRHIWYYKSYTHWRLSKVLNPVPSHPSTQKQKWPTSPTNLTNPNNQPTIQPTNGPEPTQPNPTPTPPKKNKRKQPENAHKRNSHKEVVLEYLATLKLLLEAPSVAPWRWNLDPPVELPVDTFWKGKNTYISIVERLSFEGGTEIGNYLMAL